MSDAPPARRNVRRRPISVEVPCARCGYNLRGLDPEGNCPECGSPVGPSLLEHRQRLPAFFPPLRGSDPAWVRRIVRAIHGLILCGAVSVLTGPLVWLAIHNPSATWRLVTLTATVATWTLAACCAWQLGSREPGSLHDDDDRRLTLRASVLTACVSPLLVGLDAASPVLVPVCGVAIAAAVSLPLLRLRQLLGRAGLLPLANEAGRLAWILAIATVLRVLSLRVFIPGMPGAVGPIRFASLPPPGLAMGPLDMFLGAWVVKALSHPRGAEFRWLPAAAGFLGLTGWTFAFLARAAAALSQVATGGAKNPR